MELDVHSDKLSKVECVAKALLTLLTYSLSIQGLSLLYVVPATHRVKLVMIFWLPIALHAKNSQGYIWNLINVKIVWSADVSDVMETQRFALNVALILLLQIKRLALQLAPQIFISTHQLCQ
jgi:hypothetical protein